MTKIRAGQIQSPTGSAGKVLTAKLNNLADWEYRVLDDLYDLEVSSPGDGDLLVFDDDDNKWKSRALPGADEVGFTPAVISDWDASADPGNVDDALDQLAERVDDLELGVPGVSARVFEGWNDYVRIGTGVNGSSYCFKGNRYIPSRSIRIYAIAYFGTVIPSDVYKAMIYTVDGGAQIDVIYGTSATVTIPAGAVDTSRYIIWFMFSTPVDLTAGTKYHFAIGNTSAADNESIDAVFTANSVPAPFDCSDGAGETTMMAENNPVVGTSSGAYDLGTNQVMGFMWSYL